MTQKIIVALDVPTPHQAQALVDGIRSEWYKVGLELIYSNGGLDFTRKLIDSGHNIFLDAKLSDIPTTMARAVKNICRGISPHMLSVRCSTDAAMDSTSGVTKIIYVPTLTSDNLENDAIVNTLCHGVVCRGVLAKEYRKLNPTLKIIVPGIRPSRCPPDDHKQPQESFKEADYLVVGRPITMSNNPGEAYKNIKHMMTNDLYLE